MTKIKTVSAASLPALLAPFEGGFFAGLYKQGTETRALIISGIEGDLDEAQWGEYGQDVGAKSYTDSLANTDAMAEAGSDIAKNTRALRIGGFEDWAIPARDPLELLYRYFKPTEEENYTYRNGENPSALPPTYPYTEENPLQTSAEAFRAGSEHAMQDVWYWSSTQYSGSYAWAQYFHSGSQDSLSKDSDGRVRAVRSVVVTN